MKSTYFSLMNSKNRGFMSDVDQLIEQTPLDLVLQQYGLPLSHPGSSEHRMNCVFNDACSDSQYGNLSVKLDVAKQIYCHNCSVRGNLLTLIHGLETRHAPASGRLRGQEFKIAVATLRKINGVIGSSIPSTAPAVKRAMGHGDSTPDPEVLPSERGNEASVQPSFNINTPLHRHEKDAARELADLHKDLVTNVSQMSPEAAAYVRKRGHWMTPELMQKWGCGWIPGNGRSLFRKNYFVYTHRNTRGDIVSYSGRDLNFESKWKKWIKSGKPEGKKPNKHRYVSGFKRGAELYGGQASRLEEPHIKNSLEVNGLVVVEGMNDVIRLDELGVCAIGLTGARATRKQIGTIADFAKRVAGNRILLLPDCDGAGEEGFKELLWRLNESGTNVRLGMSSEMYDGSFSGKQPEDLSQGDWNSIGGMSSD